MATLQAALGLVGPRCWGGMIGAMTVNVPKLQLTSNNLSLPKLPARDLLEELEMRDGYKTTTTHIEKKANSSFNTLVSTVKDTNASDDIVIAKLYAIMEAVADRAEMHRNIGEQRNNWNHLLLTSINAITLTAATMAGIAAIAAASSATIAPLVALKLSSTLLYVAATGTLLVMNKIQPSQLAEEQRNATRLFKQLHGQIQTTLSLYNPSIIDVKEAMEKVLALDKAYPLPLLGSMLDKFPSIVDPAVWWPQQRIKQEGVIGSKIERNNGWNGKLEEEMRELVKVLKRKDTADYLRLSKIALKVNKILAFSGPLLTGLAAIGSAFVGSPSHGSWAVIVGVIAGALASVVNTVEHGGQVGMVFEMYRSTAGFFRLMEESIELNLNKRDVERRENGEVFEMKVALQLGRSISELKHFAASSSSSSFLTNGKATHEEFASKLF